MYIQYIASVNGRNKCKEKKGTCVGKMMGIDSVLGQEEGVA